MLCVNGHADGPPLHSLGLQAYHQAGVFAAIGVVAALLARERTGRGQHVDVSLQAAVAGVARARARASSTRRARRAAPGHAALDALLPRRPLPRRLGDALHARRLDVAHRVGEVRRLRRGDRRPATRRRSMARQAAGRAHLRRARRLGRPLHGRRAVRGRAAPPHPVRGRPRSRGAARRPAPRRARLLRADRASRRSGGPCRSPARPFRIGDAPWRVTPPPRLGADARAARCASWRPTAPAKASTLRCARSPAFACSTSPGSSPGPSRPASSPTSAPTSSRWSGATRSTSATAAAASRAR